LSPGQNSKPIFADIKTIPINTGGNQRKTTLFNLTVVESALIDWADSKKSTF
jgi:hypothetical protein